MHPDRKGFSGRMSERKEDRSKKGDKMKSFDELKEGMEKSLNTMKEAKNNSTIIVGLEKEKLENLDSISDSLENIDKSLNSMAEMIEKIYKEFRCK